jgi:endonuclease YncB( thermonuclease family)
MANLLTLALLLPLLLAWQAPEDAAPAGGPPEPPAGGAALEAIVNRVIDGASLDALVEGRRTAVGYLGIEAPFPHQPCGAEALTRNRELAGSRVLLVADPAYELDQVGRRLYHAYAADGAWIEAILVSEGLARAVRTEVGRGAELAALQAEVEAAGRGCLWEMKGAG